MTNRRDFIKKATVASTASFMLPGLFSFRNSGTKKIGLQLYTVRDDIEKDLQGTLKKVADIGYKWIEAAGYKEGKFYGQAPQEFSKMISDLGMKLVSSHTAIDPLSASKITDDHIAAGCEYIVLPHINKDLIATHEKCMDFVERLNKTGEIVARKGLKFAYHNHAFEFEPVGDTLAYDLLLNNTNEYVAFEMDLYWVTKAGKDPVDYFEKFPRRFELWHVKDMEKDGDGFFTEVGNGEIDFGKIFAKKERAGMKYFFVEQDKTKNHSPLESIKLSFDYLQKAKFI